MEIYYKRNLPHFVPADSIFFVTFRLEGSLPVKVINQLREDYLNEKRKIAGSIMGSSLVTRYQELKENYFNQFDIALHRLSNGPYYLGEECIARIVYDSLLFRDKRDYDLFAFTIMPNHVHIIIRPLPKVNEHSKYILSDIMASLKKYTSRRCNKILNRSGSFWQKENYDQVVRNYEHFIRLIKYVLNNPVSAGLADCPENWPWNYYNL